MSILIKNASIYSEEVLIKDGFIYVEDGEICRFGKMEDLFEIDSALIFDLKHKGFVLPGFIDVHIHGAGGGDTMDGTKQSLRMIAEKITEEGTTSFLATTMTQSNELIEKALTNVEHYMKNSNPAGEAEIIGIHLEGPFINSNKAGAQPKEFIVHPLVEKFEKWQSVAQGNIRVVTIAPEIEGSIELIKYLSTNGVISSLGHSAASFENVKKAVEAGATHVTHLYNAMTGLNHREPGLAAAALLFNDLRVELISDGIHVHPEMINLAIKVKGTDNVMLITDAICAKGLQVGEYALGGQRVFVKDREVRLEDGTLAGSVLLMSEAIRNISIFTGLPLEQIIKMASSNPAKQLGIFDRKGSISVGKDADITVMDKDFNVLLTVCRGKIAYLKDGFF